jgi:excisionase family DNA binding protein
MSERETLLDIKEAARFLSVSETSLRRWTNSGRLPCLRIGRRRERRFRHADLLAFLEQPDYAGPFGAEAPPSPASEAPSSDSIADGSHLCGLYGTDSDLVRLAVTFLAGGLGSSAVSSLSVVVGPADSRARIMEALEQRIPSVVDHVRAGRMIAADYEATPDAQIDFFRARFTSAMRDGVRSFRVLGDLSGFAERHGAEATARYESAYSSTIAARYPVVTLCAYDVRPMAGPELLGALGAHPDTFAHRQHIVSLGT